MLDSRSMYKDYLNRFSLSFKKKKDQTDYENETKFQIFESIKFFIFLCNILTIIHLIFGQTETEIYLKVIIAFIVFLLACLLTYLAKKCLMKNKIYLKIFLSLLIFIEAALHIHLSMPRIIKKINGFPYEKQKNFEVIYWTFMAYGVAFEMIISIILINLRWIETIILKFSLYGFIIARLFGDLDFTDLYSVHVPLLLVFVISSITLSYLNEKSYKELYVSLKRNQENLNCFEKLIEKNIPNIIFILKFDEPFILYANSKAKEFFKLNNNENPIFLEKLENILLPSDDQENHKSNIMTAYHTLTEEKSFTNFSDVEDNDFKSYEGIYQKTEKSEIESCCKTTFNFEIKMGAIRWKSERAVLILLNDVSSKAKIQNLNEINNYKDMLLATVSHDLRTPLGAIIGFLEILLEKVADKKLLKYVSAAYKSSKILLFMINDILDFSQISNKKIKLNYEEVFIQVVLDGIFDILKYQSKKKGLKLVVEISEIIENIKVLCDPIRLQQILLNLIGNAIKFTFQGEVKLAITIDACEMHDYSNQKVIFKIIDTGIGIHSKNISKIFELFYKVEYDDEKINKKGIGLGLFVSQNLARLMHDEGIMARSEPNQGSEFTFSIPTNIDFDESSSKIDENTIKNNVKVSILENRNNLTKVTSIIRSKKLQLKVLLVDDDVMNILIHKKYLELYQIKYETALNGVQALEIIEKNAQKNDFFSVILLDCNMPILNGFQTADHIQKLIQNKIIPSVPIVALTANVTLNDIELCQKSGMKYFLAKPVSKIKFREKLMEILRIDL